MRVVGTTTTLLLLGVASLVPGWPSDAPGQRAAMLARLQTGSAEQKTEAARWLGLEFVVVNRGGE